MVQTTLPVSLSTKILAAAERHSRRDGGAKAIVLAEDQTQFLTYADFIEKSKKAATFFHKRGFGHEQVVCHIHSQPIEYFYGVVGAFMVGGTVCPADPKFTEYEIRNLLTATKCSMVVINSDQIDKIQHLVKSCPDLKTIICINRDRITLPDNIFDWEDLLETEAERLPHFDFSSSDVAFLPFSSGTTGGPKGVQVSHKQCIAAYENYISHAKKHFFSHIFEGKDDFGTVVPVVTPFNHMFALGTTIINLLLGHTTLIFAQRSIELILESIEKFKSPYMNISPPFIVSIVKSDLHKKYDLTSLRLMMVSAAPLGKELGMEMIRLAPNLRVIQGYGSTECVFVTVANTLNDIELGTYAIGIPLPNVRAKIVDLEGNLVQEGTRGELLIAGDNVMTGYLNNEKATKVAFSGEWFHTGDVAVQLPSGDLMIVDRIKEMIKSRGIQVSPAEIEGLLISHKDISDCGVIGIPDQAVSERIIAYVVRSSPKLSEVEVLDFVKQNLAEYKWPARIIFEETIPKSPAGKILRRILKQKYEESFKN